MRRAMLLASLLGIAAGGLGPPPWADAKGRDKGRGYAREQGRGDGKDPFPRKCPSARPPS